MPEPVETLQLGAMQLGAMQLGAMSARLDGPAAFAPQRAAGNWMLFVLHFELRQARMAKGQVFAHWPAFRHGLRAAQEDLRRDRQPNRLRRMALASPRSPDMAAKWSLVNQL